MEGRPPVGVRVRLRTAQADGRHTRSVDYGAVAAVMLDPGAAHRAPPELPTSPARRLRDALEPIATQGWWAREVHEHPSVAGLGFFESYVWGRAASLGAPSAAVVVAAFGVFEPAFLGAVYERARSKVAQGDVLNARERGAASALGAVLGAEEVSVLADALLDAVEHLPVTARPLFAGLRSLPVPEDPYGRLWRAAELVREHRGDGHLAACIAAGLDPVESNLLTELWIGYAAGEYTATRGFSEERVAEALDGLGARRWVADGRLTPAGRAAREAVEDATDRTEDQLMARLGHRAEDLIARAEQLSAPLVEAGRAPTDPRKRAAG